MQTLHINREACPQETHADISPSSPQSQNINGVSWRTEQFGLFNGRISNSPTIVMERLTISETISNASGSPFERSYATSPSSGYMDVASSRTEEDAYGLGLNSPLLLTNFATKTSPPHFSVCFWVSVKDIALCFTFKILALIRGLFLGQKMNKWTGNTVFLFWPFCFSGIPARWKCWW